MKTSAIARNLLVYLGGTGILVIAGGFYSLRWRLGNRVLEHSDGSVTTMNTQLVPIDVYIGMLIIVVIFTVVNRHALLMFSITPYDERLARFVQA